MKIIEKIFNGEKYYNIDKYNFPFGTIHKFANQNDVIFCMEENNDYKIITDKKLLKKIMKNFDNLKIKDIL